jgi:AraC family transcriptional regulator
MSTPIHTLSHRNHPRFVPESATRQNHLSLTRFGCEQRFTLQHYAIYLVLKGKGKYQLSDQCFAVEAGQFVLVNAFQPLHIIPAADHEVLCLHLTPESLKLALAQIEETEDWAELKTCLLPDGHIELCEQVYQAQDTGLGQYLSRLAHRFVIEGDGFPEDLSPIGAEVAQHLLRTQIEAYRQLLNLTSTKLSTKRELYRRLCIARMHMHNHLDEALDLDTLAQVACLSKYHFIRLFKEAFDQTPRQYLIARRLERARSLLIHSRKSFHEICQEVGLKDSSSFGRLFKRNFGATPHLYRQRYAAS